MNNVSIIGIGQTEVKEMWDTSIRHLAWYAIEAALDDAHSTKLMPCTWATCWPGS